MEMVTLSRKGWKLDLLNAIIFFMVTQSISTALNCTQCGGELHPDEGELFITCPFCGATVYVDKTQVVFHWYLAPTLDAQKAAGALARWMSGSQTVKDLDKKSRVNGYIFQYFPLWYFKVRRGKTESIELQPGAATSITELRKLTLPAGDLSKYDSTVATQSVEPSVPLDAARGWLLQAQPGAEIRESALVHIPIYIFKYVYKNQTFTAVVEAATGAVLANIFPAKAEAPYLLAGGITAAVYLCLASFPLFGSAFSNSGGAAAFGLAVLIGVIAAPFLFAFAVWVASKV
jgi:predicted RNA-binding Zn-ribbon protein involved in translation (DUF1610 family)